MLSPQRDNFCFLLRKNFRFFENELRFSFAIKSKDNWDGKGTYHVAVTFGEINNKSIFAIKI